MAKSAALTPPVSALLYNSAHTHTHTKHTVSVCTLPDCQRGGVDQKQQDVVEKALEHRRVSVEVISQVLAGQTDSAD